MHKKFFVILILILIFFSLLFLNSEEVKKIEASSGASSYSIPCTGNCGSATCSGPCGVETDCLKPVCNGSPNACPNLYSSILQWQNCSCNHNKTCFCMLSVVKGSKVLMADGTYENIENIKAGDQVKSFNIETQELVSTQVKNTAEHQEKGYLIINNSLKVTRNQYIYLDKKFQKAEDAKLGNVLLNEKGQEVEIFSINFIPEEVSVYHLTVDCQNNFFADGYLVHNQDPMCVGEFDCSISGSCGYDCFEGYVNCDGNAGCECNIGGGDECINNVCESPEEPPACECTSGDCCDECDFRPSSYACDFWDEYNCPWGTGCGSDIGKNTYYRHCSGSSASCAGNVTESGWEVVEPPCSEWQICSAGGCVCSSSCLETPSFPRPENNEQNVNLPVTLGWKEIPGARSYKYRIIGAIGSTHATTNSAIVGNCILKSNSAYDWQVQPCCDLNGNDCGDWWGPTWKFKTSLAPELLSPEFENENVSVPVTLDWCDVKEAQSYYIQRYEKGTEILPILVAKENNILPSIITDGVPWFTKNNSYQWKIATCLNPDGTKCGFHCQNNQEGNKCGTYGHLWNFKTTDNLKLSPPILKHPGEINGTPPTINLSDYLAWQDVLGTRSYFFQIKQGEDEIFTDYALTPAVYLKEIWNHLDFDVLYNWRVKSCWDDKGKDCEENWSEKWRFRTTGARPVNLKEGPISEEGKIIVPTKFEWDAVPGAASYFFQLSDSSNFSSPTVKGKVAAFPNPHTFIDYPNLKQESSYYWRIATCADEEGRICGAWSSENGKIFETFKLSRPENPDPPNNGELPTYEYYLKWENVEGARAYQYKLDFQGKEKIPLTAVYTNSARIPVEQLELGEYTWYVRACLDKNCQEFGDPSASWRFTLVEKTPPVVKGRGGLVPCGRHSNVPDPYDIDERETCDFKHIFLLLRNILDFVLWYVGLMVLVLLTLLTAVMFYFSMGSPATLAKVKSVWRSAGIGCLILLLSYWIISTILAVIGYKVGILGPWWVISF